MQDKHPQDTLQNSRGTLLIPKGVMINYVEPGIIVSTTKDAYLYAIPPTVSTPPEIEAKHQQYPFPLKLFNSTKTRNSENIKKEAILRRGLIFPNTKLLVSEFEITENGKTNLHSFLLLAACFKPHGKTKNDMPESGKGVKIIDVGFVYKDQTTYNRSNCTEHFQPFSEDIFPTLPTVDDIKQGTHGDCFLLSALISILSKPGGAQFIQSMMLQNENTTTVRLYHNQDKAADGTPKPKYYATQNSTHMLGDGIFASQHIRKWVHMLEKTYAGAGLTDSKKGDQIQVYGSYSTIYGDGGRMSCAYQVLTGQTPTVEKVLSDRNLPWVINKDDFEGLKEKAEAIKGLISLMKGNPNEELLGNLSKAINQGFSDNKFFQILGPETFVNFVECLTESNITYSEDDDSTNPDVQQTQAEAIDAFNNFIRNKFKIRNLQFKDRVSRKFKEYIFFDKPYKNEEVAYQFCGPIGSGLYTKQQLDCYYTLSDIIKENAVSTSTTDKFPGGNPVKGLRSSHAYALIALKEEIINDKKVKFVVLRNPWRHTGRRYNWNAKYFKDIAYEVKEGAAEFALELSDYTKYFDYYTYCKPTFMNEELNDGHQNEETEHSPPLEVRPKSW